MISNDDISEELAERINECVIWYDGPQVDVAKIVELLLDAELVSPPCHLFRHIDGSVMSYGTTPTLPLLFPGKSDSERSEHWKGQTQ